MASFEQLYRYNIVLDWIKRQHPRHAGEPRPYTLDVGCHDGTLCRMLVAHGATVFGLDAFSAELQVAERHLWSYLQRDLNRQQSLPFRSASFDCVTALEILEHIIDTDYFLEEIHRVLKAGGTLMISTPNINMLKNRLRVPLGLYPYGLEYRTEIHHVRLYNLATLLSHLRATGFEVVRYRGTHLVPQRFLSQPALSALSNLLATRLPTLASNLMLCARKPLRAGAELLAR